MVKGWLATIMQTFQRQPQAGIIGPIFMGANDYIQEAGGLVFSDAQVCARVACLG